VRRRDPVKRITRDRALVYGLDGSLPPALRVAAGEPFAIETEDASSGHLTAGDRLPTPEHTPYVSWTPSKANPVGGPVFVEGVKAGGRVAVEILEVRLAPTGVAYNQPPYTPLGDARSWPDAGEYWLHVVGHEGDEAVVSERLRWPASPMIGTLACAPEWEVHAAGSAQGPFGGNLDVQDFRPGATVLLNAYHDGGLLFAGDVHGCQGDGEYFGTADESRAEVVLSAAPADGPPLEAPRVVTPETISALGIAKPLEAAAHAAVRNLLDWLVADFGLSEREAYLHVGLNSEFRLRVYQMTAIQGLDFVVGATLPRRYVAGCLAARTSERREPGPGSRGR
jgi:acetamidase/formamidase